MDKKIDPDYEDDREYDLDLKVSPHKDYILKLEGRDTRAYLGKHSGMPLLNSRDIMTVAQDRYDMNELSKLEWIQIKHTLRDQEHDEGGLKLKWQKNLGDREDFMPIDSAIYMLKTLINRHAITTNEHLKKVIASLEILKLAADAVDLREVTFKHDMFQKNDPDRKGVGAGSTYWPAGMVHNSITPPPGAGQVLECTCLILMYLI
jgi:hypothetical protein